MKTAHVIKAIEKVMNGHAGHEGRTDYEGREDQQD